MYSDIPACIDIYNVLKLNMCVHTYNQKVTMH